MIYIIDNFLGDYQFQVLYNSFNSQHFPWHYAGKFATYQPNRSRLYNFISRDPRLLYHNFYDSISTPQVWVSPNHEWLHTFFPLCNMSLIHI